MSTITCCDIPSYLNSFPPSWRKELSAVLCQIINNNSTVSCDAVKACETLTLVSDLTLDGSNILAFTYYDEQGTANYRSVDLSGLSGGSGSTYVFNNGLTEASGVVKLGGILLANTTLNLDTYSLDIPNSTGTFNINGATIQLDQENIRFNKKINTDDDSGSFTPIAFYYPSSTGLLKVAPMSFITDQIPDVPVYTSSQGVSKNTLDFRFGDTAVSGTSDSANPLTSHRDITDSGDDYRISFKNHRILIGSDNTQDVTTSKFTIVGNGATSATSSLYVTNSAGKKLLNALNNGNIGIASVGSTPFIEVCPTAVVSSNNPNPNTIVYYTAGTPMYISSANQNQPIVFVDGYACNVSKYQFEAPLVAANTSVFANIKIKTTTSLTHEGTSYSGVSNLAELQLNHTNSDYATTGNVPIQSGLLIDGSYLMPSNYTGGNVAFVKVTPTYNRSTINAITGTTPLRGFYYAPTIGSDALPVTTEIAFEATRGSVIFGDGKGNETVRFPNLTTTERNALSGTGAGEFFFNSTGKIFEYHNGNGVVTSIPQTMTAGIGVVWNANFTNQNLALTTNTTITNITNLVPGSTIILIATQDATGSRTLSIAASGYTIKTLGTISAVATETSVISIYVASSSELIVSIAAGYV